MNLWYFAHNGVHHENQTESVNHGLSTTLWLVLASVTVVVIVLGVAHLLGRSSRSIATQEEEDEV